MALTPSIVHADAADQASALLAYFGANCPSTGTWTRAAVANSMVIVRALTEIQKDPNCQSLAGAVSQADYLSKRIQEIEQDPDQKTYLGLSKQREELLMQISTASAADQPALLEQLRTTQVQLAVNSGYLQSNGDYNRQVRRANALSDLSTSTSLLMKQAIANQSCLVNHPDVLTGFAGVASAVASGMSTGGTALLAAAGVQLLATVVEFYRQSRIASALEKASQGVVATGMQCAIEALTNQWCEARDALHIIDLKARSIEQSQPKDKIWQGVDVLEGDMPLFLGWLDGVAAGVDPSNQATGDRQSRALQRRSIIQKVRAKGLGILAEKEVFFSKISNPQAQWIYLRQAIKELLSAAQSGASVNGASSLDGGNPLNESISTDQQAYYLIGVTNCPKDPSNYCVGIETYNPFENQAFKPSLDDVKANFLKWVKDSRDLVDSENATVLQPDPLFVLTQAQTENAFKKSPLNAAKNIAAYLRDTRGKLNSTGANARIFDDTLVRLESIIAKIQTALSSPADSDHSDQDVLNRIYELANLDDGLNLFRNRIEWSVRLNLTDVLASKNGVDQGISAQLLAADDILAQLKLASSSNDLTSIGRDLENSQTVVQQTLDAMLNDVFARPVNQSLKMYTKQAESARESINDPFNRSNLSSKAELCIKLLAMPAWPRGLDSDYCEGAFLASKFQKGPRSITWSIKLYKDQPVQARACVYRDWIRASKIYERGLVSPTLERLLQTMMSESVVNATMLEHTSQRFLKANRAN